MAIATPFARLSHDYDPAAGTERFILSVDLVRVAFLVLASLLTVSLLQLLRAESDK